MRIYLDNSNVFDLARQYPNRLGVIMSPSRTRPNRSLPYVYDNGRYACWRNGKDWNQEIWHKLLDRRNERQPEWVVVPDVVEDALETIHEWGKWAGWIQRTYGYRLALAVQDGMTPECLQDLHPQPDVVFIGGTRTWKRQWLWKWAQSFPHVHVGGVNSYSMLWKCQRAGADSCDGTGWFLGDQAQRKGLLRYLDRSHAGMGPEQLELEFARTFGGNVPTESHVIAPRCTHS